MLISQLPNFIIIYPNFPVVATKWTWVHLKNFTSREARCCSRAVWVSMGPTCTPPYSLDYLLEWWGLLLGRMLSEWWGLVKDWQKKCAKVEVSTRGQYPNSISTLHICIYICRYICIYAFARLPKAFKNTAFGGRWQKHAISSSRIDTPNVVQKVMKYDRNLFDTHKAHAIRESS